MSHTLPVTLPQDTWTLISNCSADYQVTSHQAIFTREDDVIPTEPPAFDGGDPAVRRVAAGLYVRFDQHENELLWGYSPIGYAFVSVIKSPNSSPGVIGEAINHFGVNTDIDILTAPMDIWSHNGLYPFATFTTAQALEIVSDSVEDDAGGDGAQQIIVEGLDGVTGLFKTETATLDGQTAVDLSGTWLAVNRMHVVDGQTGATGNNEGNIHVQVDGAGEVVSEIVALRGQTQTAIHRVASDQALSVVHIQTWFRGNQTGDAVINPVSIGTDCVTLRLRGELSIVAGAPAQREYLVGGIKINALEWFSLRVTSVSRNDTVLIGEFDAVTFGE